VDDLLRSFGEGAPHHALAVDAQDRLGLPPLAIDVDGRWCTIDGGKVEHGRRAGALTAVVPAGSLAAVVGGAASVWMLNRGPRPGAWDSPLLAWDSVLRALFEGRPLHDPASADWREPDGHGTGLHYAFGPDEDDADIAAFVADAGFAHLRGWIDPDLLPRVEREIADAAASASRDDPHHLWATMSDGSERCLRLRYAPRSSSTMAGLLEGPAFDRIGRLFADGHRRRPELPHSCEALIKPKDFVASITDLPWHRDCGGVGCAFKCAEYTVGLPLSPTTEETGLLRVIAGSHRVSAPPPGVGAEYDPGLPVVSLPTEPGDLTIHVSCALHGSIASTGCERTVVYTTYALDPLPETVGP
jgi:hypothetical protein